MTKKEIKVLVKLLEKYPELRLGQIINTVHSEYGFELFYIKDEDLLHYIGNYYKRLEKAKIYHDISCNCYDCRAGISFKAKD